MTVRSRITIYNAALLRTGNREVSDGDGSFLYRALEANYDEIVRDAFEEQEFGFGKARRELTSRSEGEFGYEDAFTMPHDVLHVVEVYLNDIAATNLCQSWDVDASLNRLMIDAGSQKVEIKYIRSGQESRWSAMFTKVIIRRLEAVIKDALEEPGEAAALDQTADFQMLKAGVKSSKNRSQNRFRRGGRLTRAHRGWRR